jgi:hypothetical protein
MMNIANWFLNWTPMTFWSATHMGSNSPVKYALHVQCIILLTYYIPYSAIGCWRYRKTTGVIRVYRGTHSTFSRRTRIFHRRYVLPPLYRASTSLPCFYLSTVLLPLYRTSGNLNIVLSIVLWISLSSQVGMLCSQMYGIKILLSSPFWIHTTY